MAAGASSAAAAAEIRVALTGLRESIASIVKQKALPRQVSWNNM
jgi:hypothetical protein